MISRQHRFHGHSSLGFVYHRGSTVRHQHLSVRFIRNQRRSTHRVAIIVSRKIHKSAVGRNRIRRRLYEIIRQHESAITEPYDIVLTVVNDQIIELPSDELERMVLDLLTRAGIVGPRAGEPAGYRHAIVKTKETRL